MLDFRNRHRNGFWLRAIAVVGAGLTVAAPVAAQSAGPHAALAFSRSIFSAPEGAAEGYGSTWGRASAQEARAAAVRDCQNNDNMITDCVVVVAFSRGCGALAVGVRGVSPTPYAGQGANVREASRAALATCNRSAGNCRVVETTCSRSSN